MYGTEAIGKRVLSGAEFLQPALFTAPPLFIFPMLFTDMRRKLLAIGKAESDWVCCRLVFLAPCFLLLHVAVADSHVTHNGHH